MMLLEGVRNASTAAHREALKFELEHFGDSDSDEALHSRMCRALPGGTQDRLIRLFDYAAFESAGKRAADTGSFAGDYGCDAACSFASSLWLVDHAGIFLRAIRTAFEHGGLPDDRDPVALSAALVNAFTDEIQIADDAKYKLVARLFLDIGISLLPISDSWEQSETNKLLSFADKASYSLSGSGHEVFVLPWAFQVEQTHNAVPLHERCASLRQVISQSVRGQAVSELELNNWAYLLLLIGHWKAATPMSVLATELTVNARNLDTLGWAHRFERNYDQAIDCLSQALELVPRDNAGTWTLVAFHKLSVLLEAGQRQEASALFKSAEKLAPTLEWTQKLARLRPLLEGEKKADSLAPPRITRQFKYDVALSFAGQDRRLAEQLAFRLQARGVRVFYDEFEKAELWGRNLYSGLADLYQFKARYCVMLVSRHYVSNRWTKLEREAAQARALSEDAEYILPIRIDGTAVPGLLPTIAHLDLQEGLDRIVDSILSKLGVPAGSAP